MKKILMVSLTLWASCGLAAEKSGVRMVQLPQPAKVRSVIPPKKVAIIAVKPDRAFMEFQRSRSQQENADSTTRSTSTTVYHLPKRVDLGMNGVPIFDQGYYGSCVTFAATAALDAAIGKGDYISQLCLLQLGNSLNENSYWPDGWNGSNPDITLSRIKEFGIITKEDQLKGVCNSATDYPNMPDHPSSQVSMSLSDYHKYSHNIIVSDETPVAIEPKMLFNIISIKDKPDRYITINNTTDSWVSPQASFTAVRKALAEGNRVIIGFLVNVEHLPNGQFKSEYDTWFASKALKNLLANQNLEETLFSWGYHEIVLYGYDDNAVVRNPTGETQKGVFFVRNSWGSDMMDKGVENMTYSYFKLMAVHAYSIDTQKLN